MRALVALTARRDPDPVEGPFLPVEVDGSLSPYRGLHRAVDLLDVDRAAPFGVVEGKAGAHAAPATAGGDR
jgi:hypothetical protein